MPIDIKYLLPEEHGGLNQICYYASDDRITRFNLQNLKWDTSKNNVLYFVPREEIVKNITDEHELLKEILLSDFELEKNQALHKPPFIYVTKGEETKSVKEAANHLGFTKSRISKTIIARDELEQIYFFTALNDSPFHFEKGIRLFESDELLQNVKIMPEEEIKKHTGMEAGCCGPFPLNRKYLDNIRYLLFKKEQPEDSKGYTGFAPLVDIGLSKKESILMRSRDVYRTLKTLYGDKVCTF